MRFAPNPLLGATGWQGHGEPARRDNAPELDGTSKGDEKSEMQLSPRTRCWNVPRGLYEVCTGMPAGVAPSPRTGPTRWLKPVAAR